MKIGRVVETIKPSLKLEKLNRELAQLVERHPYKVDVAGSNPVLPTKYLESLSKSKSQNGRVLWEVVVHE
jgi:hypothetical protein